MNTDLKIVQPVIRAPRQIEAYELPCQNFPLSNALATLSEMMISNIKCATNNMQAAVVPKDVTAMLMGWKSFKSQITFALDNNNGAQASHEMSFSIYVPTQQEIMLMPNKKFKILNNHFYRIAQVALSTDAAKVGANLDTDSFAAINSEIKTTDVALSKWVGTGVDNNNVGERVPLFVQTGTIRPDLLNLVSTSEPSPDAPKVGLPDAVDIVGGKPE